LSCLDVGPSPSGLFPYNKQHIRCLLNVAFFLHYCDSKFT